MPNKAPKIDINSELAAASKILAPAVKRLTKALRALQPKDLPMGALADTLYDLRQLSKLLNNLSAPFEDVLAPATKEVEDYFIATLPVGEATGIQGHKSRVQVTESVIPVVNNWPKFYAYIKRHNAFELLGRAVKKEAVQERWSAKKEVPGVGRFRNKKVSCTKLSGKN
jgi:hypothetical protein